MSAPFVHLQIHSEYSIVDGITRLKPLFQQAKSMGYTAIALTDQHNVYAHVKWYKQALAHGIKPIFGADVMALCPGAETPYALTLLCMNQAGHTNLLKLLSLAYQQRGEGGPIIVRLPEPGSALTRGLIALSGGLKGAMAHHLLPGEVAEAKAYIQFMQQTFHHHFYLSVARSGLAQEADYIQAAYDFSLQHDVPLVAVGDVQFLKKNDAAAHKARVCIERGLVLEAIKSDYTYTESQYFTSPEDMAERFHDLPEALENAGRIAQLCNVELDIGKVYLPDFPVAEGETVDQHLERCSYTNLTERLGDKVDDAYKERLAIELNVIQSMGFSGYFMIVADFINWAKQQGIPVGPGRGSGAGSLVAYVLGITDVDPLPYGLLFERFLNPERVSMPDFDIDFCMLGRDEVIRYVTRKYGRDNVSQIITYGTMAAKAVIRDVGRVLGHPYGFVDNIAKLIPFDLGMTLTKALEEEPKLEQLCQEDEGVAALYHLALKLEGVTRNVGKHAGGVVIAPKPLVNYTALYLESEGDGIVSQYDKDDIESIGLVKFDFLGLRTLTIIDWAVKCINTRHQLDTPFCIDDIPLDDRKTIELLQSCETTGVFQLESRGMKDLIKRLVPDCLEDVVALVALFRPGPLQSGMVDDFIDRKHGRADMAFPHPMLADILRPTYGVILYQEQVMQIAQVLAGYSLGGADLLRRAMGKKKPEEMAKQRDIFVDGSIKNGVDAKLASDIFDLIEKFSGYGFNKSHSVAYALISYRTAYLKAHYPAEFMSAVLSSDMDNTDKLYGFLEATETMGITVLPPCLQRSYHAFTVESENTIRYGFGAIKGMGEAVAHEIVKIRDQEGPYAHLLDLCLRIDSFKLNKRVLEALVKCGALDSWQLDRAYLLASIEKAVQRADQLHRDKARGQQDLFAAPQQSDAPEAFSYVTDGAIMPSSVKYAYEKETLGHYFSGHPFKRYARELSAMGVLPLGDLDEHFNTVIRVAGYVSAIRTLKTKRNKKFAFVTLDDGIGSIDIGVFSDVYIDVESILQKDAILVVRGTLSVDEYSGRKIVADSVETLDTIRQKHKPTLRLQVENNRDFVTDLCQALTTNKGGEHNVVLWYTNAEGAVAHMAFSDNYRIHINEALLDKLEQTPGLTAYDIVYA
jgi:DNA polymerase-3 subunit alpha